jgi:anti-sigma factor RsiW
MMIDPTMPVTEGELHAYVDGELPADRVGAVENWLATHPEDMSLVEAWRAQMNAIRTRYGAVADEPVPPRFDLDRLVSAARPWKRIAAAAAVIAFLTGGTAGWVARGAFAGLAPSDNGFAAFTAEAIEAYKLYVVEVRHPVEVTAADADHLVQWLSKRVGYQLRAPNLDSLGLKLVGGRLLPGPTGAAAFFMYENASGERYTLYCGRANARTTALRYDENTAASAVYWASDNVIYVISGKGDHAQLKNVAVAAYEQIDARAPARSGG